METSLLIDYKTSGRVTHVGSRGKDTFNQSAGSLGRQDAPYPQKSPVESLLCQDTLGKESNLVNHCNKGQSFLPNTLTVWEL